MTIYNFIIGITIYMMIKIVLWWLVFGTARVVAGKYSGKVWRSYTGWGLLIMVGVILMDAFIGYYPPAEDTTLYTVFHILFWILTAIGVREVVTLAGLIVGDWHPLHPRLRFWGFGKMFVHEVEKGKGFWDDDNLYGGRYYIQHPDFKDCPF